MPTLSFSAQLLRPHEQTQFHRHTASTVYCVVEGEGETLVDDTRLEWQRNDVFVIPSWAWHAHTNKSATQDAVLSPSRMPKRCVGSTSTESKVALRREISSRS